MIDPFNGRSLSREALEERLTLLPARAMAWKASSRRRWGCSCRPRHRATVLARLLHNLKEIHRTAEDWPRLLAVQQRLVVLLPHAADEVRDRGLAWAELGRADEAAKDLAAYLEARPDAPRRGRPARAPGRTAARRRAAPALMHCPGR